MKKNTSKSRSNGVENIKLMIVAISLTAILLFWAVFSAHDSQALIEEAQNNTSALVINLPPVPTVVPVNNEEEDSTAGPQPAPTLRSVTEPEKKYAVPQEGPVIIGGGGGGGGGGGSTSTKAS